MEGKQMLTGRPMHSIDTEHRAHTTACTRIKWNDIADYCQQVRGITSSVGLSKNNGHSENNQVPKHT